MDISTEICGIELKNPFILSSGILGLSASLMRRVVDNGAGAVVTKGLGIKPREGHPNPTVIANEDYMLNAVGLSNPGVENFASEIQELKKENINVIANIFGKNTKEFVKVARKAESFGVDAVEMNVSCPNVEEEEGIGSSIGKDPELSAKYTRAVRKAVDIPVIVKLSPNVNDIREIASAVEDAGASAISAINTVGPGMLIDIKTAEPILSNNFGGMSGPAIKPISVASIYKISQVVDLPLIGIGGVRSGRDAIELMMAGASVVGIGSAVRYEGINVFENVKTEMIRFLGDRGYESIKEIVGVANE